MKCFVDEWAVHYVFGVVVSSSQEGDLDVINVGVVGGFAIEVGSKEWKARMLGGVW
jgi:hypothetical protein